MKGKSMITGLNNQNGEPREENDFYATDPSAVEPLIDFMGWREKKVSIWENSCGEGHLVKPLLAAGAKVLATDLVDRGYGIAGINFLEQHFFETGEFDAIVMNPPYKKALEFVQKSLNIAPTVCAFLRITFLESERRKPFFEQNPPRYVCVFSKRVKCSKNAKFPKDEASAVCYAWFVWEKGYNGKPEIVWF